MKTDKVVAMVMLLVLSIIVLPAMVEKASGSGSLGGFWHLDEGTGTTASDSSGNGNHGTIFGGAIWTNGKIGKALEFDGVNDYVNVPDSNSLDITGKITMEAWIYPYTVTKTQVIVQKYNYSGPPYNGAYYLGVGGYGYNNKILLGLSHNGYNFYYTLSNTNITANTWTHVAATSNGTHMAIYINGIRDKVATYPPGVIYASAAPLRIGCFLPELGVSRFFNGIIDEVRVSAGTIWTVDDDRVQCPNADFTSIQAAINKANPDDTIIVHSGTYHENLVVNKALTIKVASKPIIDGGAAGNCISVGANNVVISGFEIRNGYNGISGQTSGSTFSDNIIHDNLNIPGSAGVGILLWGDNDNNIITRNEIYNNDRQGIFIGYQDDSKISTENVVENNVIYNNGLYRYANGPDASEYGIQLWCADYNLIKNNEIYLHDDWFAYPGFDFAQGIYLCDANGNTVVGNYLHDNNYGVGLWHPSRSIGNNYINYNNIAGNTGYGVRTFDGPPAVDARFNWWGKSNGPTHLSNPSGTGDKISNNVDYSPWLGFMVGTTPMTWHVNPTGAPGAIQEAIDEASSGDTIMVHAGTYNEALYINKDISIFGASLPIIQGSGLFNTNYGAREAVVFVENAVVTLWQLDIEGQGLGPGKNYGVIYEESMGTIRGCIISPNTISDMVGNAIGIWDSSDVNVRECTIKNFGRIGVFFYDGCSGGVYSSTIEGQVYSNEGFVNYGIEVEPWNNPCDVEILGNDIYNCDNTHPSPSWSSAGIVIDGWVAFYDLPSSTVVMSCNDIYNNYYGIEVIANPYSYAYYNNIYSNREYGVIEDANSFGNNVNFDARYNWWGDASGPKHLSNPGGIGDEVSDYVIFSPWLLVEKVPPLVHDVAILDVVSSSIRVAVGTTIQVDVEAKNEGNTYETFDVSLYYDNNLINTKTITDLTPGTQKLLTFDWNTAGATPGMDYTIKAVASIVLGETDVGDNTKSAIEKVRVGEPPLLESQSYKANLLNQIVGINITLNDLEAYWKVIGVQFRLCYNSTLLQFINVTEGPFIKPPPRFSCYYDENVPPYGQSVIFGIILLPNATGEYNPPFPNGTGTVATVYFKAIYQERGLEKPPLTCELTLKPLFVDAMILDAEGEWIPCNIQNGTYKMFPTHIADFNYDGRVDMSDVYRIAKAFGERPGRPRWDPIVDINNDSRIDMADLYICCKGFGWRRTDP